MGEDPNGKIHRLDVNTRTSSRRGMSGFIETALRRFRGVFHGLLMLPLYGAACICAGLAMVPGTILVQHVSQATASSSPWIHYPALGISFATGYFLYGFSLILLLPAANFLLRAKLKPWRGPYYSLESIGWYIHNGATYLMRYSFLEFITPSPFNLWFYRMMGMKIGHGTVINSTHISDPSLIEIGEKVTIGGSASIVAHYGQGGFLVLAPVKIGDGATIGLRATIMGGAIIGKNAKILSNSVVLPNTVVPDGETWGGVPAQKINVFANTKLSSVKSG